MTKIIANTGSHFFNGTTLFDQLQNITSKIPGSPADLGNLEKPGISLCDLGNLENQGKFFENLENIFLT